MEVYQEQHAALLMTFNQKHSLWRPSYSTQLIRIDENYSIYMSGHASQTSPSRYYMYKNFELHSQIKSQEMLGDHGLRRLS